MQVCETALNGFPLTRAGEGQGEGQRAEQEQAGTLIPRLLPLAGEGADRADVEVKRRSANPH
ncbi:hypothetical protein C1N56_02925 [Pantoea sp. SGAir0175]